MNIVPNLQIFKPSIMVQQRQNSQRTFLASNNQDMFVHSVPSFRGGLEERAAGILKNRKTAATLASLLPTGFAALIHLMKDSDENDKQLAEETLKQNDTIEFLIKKCSLPKRNLKKLSEDNLKYLLNIIDDVNKDDNYDTPYINIPELIKAVNAIEDKNKDCFRNLICELDSIKKYKEFPKGLDIIAKFINEHPDKLQELKSHIASPELTKGFIKNITRVLTDESIPQEIRDFLFMSFDTNIPLIQQENITPFVIAHPEFVDIFKEYITKHYNANNAIFVIDESLSHSNSKNVLKYIFSMKKDNGNLRFINPDHILGIKDCKNIEDIRYLAELKSSDGEYLLDESDILNMIVSHRSDIKLYKNSKPPEKNLDAYVLYERVFKIFQDEVSTFGCKTFRELEEKIKTLDKKQRVQAGKLLGKIKKHAIDTFFNSLPAIPAAMLSGKNGRYTAADLDRAIKILNSNSLLRKYLVGIEKTGEIKSETKITDKYKSIDYYGSFNPLETALLSKNTACDDTLYYILLARNDLELYPAELRQLYEQLNNLYKLIEDKYIEYVKNSAFLINYYKGDIENAVQSGIPKTEIMYYLSVSEYLIGLGNLSSLVYNEPVTKIKKYLSNIDNLYNIGHSVQDGPELNDMLQKVVKEKKLKYNNLKDIINIATALGNSDEIKKFYNMILKSKEFDSNKIKRMILGEIYKRCGINTEVTDKILESWDSEYMPYVINALSSLTDKNKELLISLLKADFEGKYEQYLFDPNTPNGALNIQSRQIFEENGLNFDEVMNFDGKIEFRFKPNATAIEPVNTSIVEDFRNMLADTKIGPIFREFMQKEKIKIISDKKFTVQGKELSRQDMIGFITLVNKFISNNSKVIESSNIADVKDHFVNRKRALTRTMDDMKKEDTLTISLWERRPKHDLFLGHYCQCCISLDGINNNAIVQSLSHTVDQVAELKTSDGTTVGKVKMLFLKDTKSGEIILLANGFEIIEPYNFNDTIRDKFVEFMRKYSKAVAGKEIPIYTGRQYQKINIDDLGIVKGNFQLLGRTPDNTYHLDSYAETESPWPEELDRPHDLKLKIMYKPE